MVTNAGLKAAIFRALLAIPPHVAEEAETYCLLGGAENSPWRMRSARPSA
jgi:hypothetical protein